MSETPDIPDGEDMLRCEDCVKTEVRTTGPGHPIIMALVDPCPRHGGSEKPTERRTA